MANPVFIVFGCGPGIGLATASVFASKHHRTIVLVSRNEERLAADKQAVVAAAGRDVEVLTFPTDLSDFGQLRKTLKKIENFGRLGTVFFNAARITPTDILTTNVEDIEQDFRVYDTLRQALKVSADLKHFEGYQSCAVYCRPMGYSFAADNIHSYNACLLRYELGPSRAAIAILTVFIGGQSKPAEHDRVSPRRLWRKHSLRLDQGQWASEY